MREIWKDIKGYEGLYQISSLGNVKSLDRIITFVRHGNEQRVAPGKKLKPYKDGRGYMQVCLTNKSTLVHRLVGIHFIPNPENKREINHKDGIKINNKVDNLEWCTTSENCLHAHKYGLRKALKGERNNGAKLTQKEVVEIRSKYIPRLYSQYRLAKEYGVSQTAIKQIVNHKLWKYES